MFPRECGSDSFEHDVHLVHVGFISDNLTIDFYPGMRVKGYLLGTNHELCCYPMAPKEASRGRGTLQAEYLFPIPDAGNIDRVAQFRQRDTRSGVCSYVTVTHRRMESGELLAFDMKAKAYELHVCPQDQN